MHVFRHKAASSRFTNWRNPKGWVHGAGSRNKNGEGQITLAKKTKRKRRSTQKNGRGSPASNVRLDGRGKSLKETTQRSKPYTYGELRGKTDGGRRGVGGGEWLLCIRAWLARAQGKNRPEVGLEKGQEENGVLSHCSPAFLPAQAQRGTERGDVFLPISMRSFLRLFHCVTTTKRLQRGPTTNVLSTRVLMPQ